MTATTSLMITVTLLMAVVMVPRIYWAWHRADIFFEEGEAWKLRLLQTEENRWARRNVVYGALILTLVWVGRHLPLGVSGPQETVLALYAGISFVLAVVDSLLAQRIEVLAHTIPVAVKAGQEE